MKKEKKIRKQLSKNLDEAKNIIDNDDKFEELLEKVDNVGKKNKGPIDEMISNIRVLYNLVIDWKHGDYTDVSKTTILSILGGFIYLVSPVDIIPDFLGPVGLIDDAFVLKIVMGQVDSDIKNYQEWKSLQNIND